jgi:hypothetical protein
MFEGSDARKKIRVMVPNPNPNNPQAVGIVLIGVDSDLDLALIKMNVGPLANVAPVPGLWYKEKKQCLSVGYDNMKMPFVQRPATIVRTDNVRTWTQEKPWHGRSGGALLDGQFCIGIVSGYTATNGFYSSHQALVSFLSRFDGSYQPAAPIAQGAPQLQNTPIYYAPPQNCPGGICYPKGK